MITQENGYTLISTKKTSLLLHIDHAKKPIIEYYGRRLVSMKEADSLTRKHPYLQGCNIQSYPELEIQTWLDESKLALSTLGKGDLFSPSLILASKESTIFDFTFLSDEIKQPTPVSVLPTPHGAKEEYVLTLEESALNVLVKIHYFVYEDQDVIGVYTEIINQNAKDLRIEKAMSLQLPLVNQDYDLISTYGNWAGELNTQEQPVCRGRMVLGSHAGFSSNQQNPFFLLKAKHADCSHGNVYGFNLVYSGDFESSVEMNSFENIRVQVGISSTRFHKVIKQNESFITPMAVMTYSSLGVNGMSHHMHDFVNDCVIPPYWRNRIRPVAYNNWEATNFKFNRGKITSLMKDAADLGVELFVLDDGWFSTRNDDAHGLGDWEVNEKKVSGGLGKLAEEAKKQKMKFGIWMEPEMVNDDTKTFKEHPEWVIQDKFHKPAKGRNQYVLDLRQKEVQDFVYQSVSQTLKSGDISYLKWDCNRDITDEDNRDGSFFYDYMVGLYAVLGRLVDEFPEVLLENCASGGNRFDLGMLTYFAQSWMSDDTDSYQRLLVQEGGLLGYPLSVMSNHVAAKTSNQMLRYTSYETKFDVACFGVLGYEFDLGDLSKVEKEDIRKQIAFYKEHRNTLQFGVASQSGMMDPKASKTVQAISENEAIVGYYSGIQKPNPKEAHLLCKGLKEETLYRYEGRKESLPIKKFGNLINAALPMHLNPEGALASMIGKVKTMTSEQDKGVLSGGVFATEGAVLSQEWSGVGYDERVRMMNDFGARVYVIKECTDED